MNIRKSIVVSLCSLGVTAALGGLYGDTPDAKHAWAVHDLNRPVPAKVTAEPGQAPSDAIILFDGSNLDAWVNARPRGGPASWKIVDGGAMEVVPRTGAIKTRQSFGDCQLHLEWASPKEIKGEGQGRGNSGDFLMGNYEVQILDSYDSVTYADGQASAVYAENPPLVNACRPSGEWQTYDIIFHQPVWKDGQLLYPGSMTVLHNGVLTQDHWEMEGLSTHCRRKPLAPHAHKLPISLQEHGNPVRFRNIWIREIPSRYANTTHGGVAVSEKDVMALRQKTAQALFAKAELADADRCAALERMLEVIAYDKTAEYMQIVGDLSKAYLAELHALTGEAMTARKNEVLSLKKSLDVLTRNNVVEESWPLKVEILQIIEDNGFDKKKR